MSAAGDLEGRRQLLVQQCELDRIELALSWLDLRRSLRFGGDADEAPHAHPWIGRVLGFVLPLLGAARARRFSRYVSLALLAYRVATGLRPRAR